MLIESANGLTNVDAIAGASDRLQALIFGPADMAASLGMPALSAGGLMPDYPGDHFHYAKSRMLVAARAAGLRAIDGPHLAVDDLEGCRVGALRARALGFDGRWVVHPSQIEIVNEAFTPTREEYDRALEILGAYERATAEGRGAVRLGAEMIDEASRRWRRVWSRAAAPRGATPLLDAEARVGDRLAADGLDRQLAAGRLTQPRGEEQPEPEPAARARLGHVLLEEGLEVLGCRRPAAVVAAR